jgi:hypothetical protein
MRAYASKSSRGRPEAKQENDERRYAARTRLAAALGELLKEVRLFGGGRQELVKRFVEVRLRGTEEVLTLPLGLPERLATAGVAAKLPVDLVEEVAVAAVRLVKSKDVAKMDQEQVQRLLQEAVAAAHQGASGARPGTNKAGKARRRKPRS